MPPLVACFPVFFMFLTMGVLAAALLLVGVSRSAPPVPVDEARPRLVPVWFVVLAFVVPPVVLYLLSLVTAG